MADTYKFDQSASQLQQDFDDVEALVGGGHPDGAELYLTPEKFTSAEKTKLGDLPDASTLAGQLDAKQNVISDLENIRAGAAKGDTAYQKPANGIPSSDMTSAVQTSLGKADSAYQKPVGGIPSTDLSSGVNTSLGKADSAVQPSDLLDYLEKDVFLMNDGEPYQNSAAAESAAATSEWAGDPKKNVFQYNFNGTQRGIGNGVFVQLIYNDSGSYYCRQYLYLGQTRYRRNIALGSYDSTTGLFAISSVGSFTTENPYLKPTSGIPKSDLASGVQTSLDKADSALQYEETTDPTGEIVDEWSRLLAQLYQAITDAQNAKADYVGEDNYVYHWDATEEEYVKTDIYVKGDAGTTDYNDLDNKPAIPSALSQLTDDSTHRLVTDAEKAQWGEGFQYDETTDPTTLLN